MNSPRRSQGSCLSFRPAGALSRQAIERVVCSDGAALFAARLDGRIAGVLTLVWYDVPSGRKAWVEDVVVDAAARGCGAVRRW